MIKNKPNITIFTATLNKVFRSGSVNLITLKKVKYVSINPQLLTVYNNSDRFIPIADCRLRIAESGEYNKKEYKTIGNNTSTPDTISKASETLLQYSKQFLILPF